MAQKASVTLTLTLTHTLADNPRQQLEPWLEEVATLARGLCCQHDFSGALTIVATDIVWAQYPGNVTNMADVLANGDPPNIRGRIAWGPPPPLDPAATAVEIMLYKQATDRHQAYNVASTCLSTALVDSVGESNKTYLKTVFAGVALYALLPRQVIGTMTHRRRHQKAEGVSPPPINVVVRSGQSSKS